MEPEGVVLSAGRTRVQTPRDAASVRCPERAWTKGRGAAEGGGGEAWDACGVSLRDHGERAEWTAEAAQHCGGTNAA